MPEVFFLDGRWYMICLTSTGHGNRGGFSEPNVTRGTIYAMAERPERPYQEIEDDNVLMVGIPGASAETGISRGKVRSIDAASEASSISAISGSRIAFHKFSNVSDSLRFAERGHNTG